VIVDIPSRLSSRQRHLYEQLRAEDAEVRSQAGGSREPNARQSGGGLEAAAAAWRAAGRGPSIVSSVLLMAIGCVNLIGGIAAVANAHFFTGSAHDLIGHVRAWGWVMTIVGAAQLLAAAGVWAGNQADRVPEPCAGPVGRAARCRPRPDDLPGW